MAISDWADCFGQTVSVEPISTRDSYGAPTYGTSVDYSARVNYRSKLTMNADGEEIMARGEIWLQTTTAISAEDRVTLPDGSTPEILTVERISDQSGAHHVKVLFR